MGDILEEGNKLEEWVVGTCRNCESVSQWQRKEKIYIPPNTQATPSFSRGAFVYKCPKCSKGVYSSTTITKDEYLNPKLKPSELVKKSWIDRMIERLNVK
jgi:hypothetical protein